MSIEVKRSCPLSILTLHTRAGTQGWPWQWMQSNPEHTEAFFIPVRRRTEARLHCLSQNWTYQNHWWSHPYKKSKKKYCHNPKHTQRWESPGSYIQAQSPYQEKDQTCPLHTLDSSNSIFPSCGSYCRYRHVLFGNIRKTEKAAAAHPATAARVLLTERQLLRRFWSHSWLLRAPLAPTATGNRPGRYFITPTYILKRRDPKIFFSLPR